MPRRTMSTADSDHRSAPRCEFNPAIGCQVVDPASGARWPAWVRDISCTGISVLVEAHFAAGRLLAVELKGSMNGFFRSLRVTVRHCDIVFPNNAWLHGCSFEHALTQEEFRALVGPAGIVG